MIGLALAALLWGCAPRVGHPRVTYGDVATLPLVQPSTDRRRWYLPVHSNRAGPHVLFLDTGYDFSTCDDDLVQRLGLRTRGRAQIRGELGKVPASKARLPPIEVGGHRVEDLVCHVRDLGSTSSIRDPSEVPVAGVLGMDVLSRFHVVFDPKAGEVQLRDPRTTQPLPRSGSGVVRLRKGAFNWTGKRLRLRLQVEGRTLWPILDTGATNTYVDGERAGLDASYEVDGVTIRGTGSSGSSTRTVSYYDVHDVKLGDVRTTSVTLMDRDRPWWQPGLLGLDLLSRFRQEYDFPRRRGRLTAVRASPLPQWTARPTDKDVIRLSDPKD
ncbi:MAG: retroviral-like aspartic protease family protein [Myxococcales bacterium]|nr:retroviral-like aspartic protease family protein [Myxococcales bacterium]